MRLKAADILENILSKYSNAPLPKNELEHDLQLGGVIGLAIEHLPFVKREKAIYILTKKYRYHTGCLFKNQAQMRLRYSQLISDLWRYKGLSVYNNDVPLTANKQENTIENFMGYLPKKSKQSKVVSNRICNH